MRFASASVPPMIGCMPNVTFGGAAAGLARRALKLLHEGLHAGHVRLDGEDDVGMLDREVLAAAR